MIFLVAARAGARLCAPWQRQMSIQWGRALARPNHGAMTTAAASPATAEMKAKMRRMVLLASVSAGVLCVLPAYFYVTGLVGTPLPVRIPNLRWVT